MLGDLLIDHLVVESDWVPARKVVVKLTISGLDNVRLTGRAGVVEAIVLGFQTLHQLLVVAGRVLLLDESLGRAAVLLHLRAAVHLSHHLVEVVHLQLFAHTVRRPAARA